MELMCLLNNLHCDILQSCCSPEEFPANHRPAAWLHVHSPQVCWYPKNPSQGTNLAEIRRLSFDTKLSHRFQIRPMSRFYHVQIIKYMAVRFLILLAHPTTPIPVAVR